MSADALTHEELAELLYDLATLYIDPHAEEA